MVVFAGATTPLCRRKIPGHLANADSVKERNTCDDLMGGLCEFLSELASAYPTQGPFLCARIGMRAPARRRGRVTWSGSRLSARAGVHARCVVETHPCRCPPSSIGRTTHGTHRAFAGAARNAQLSSAGQTFPLTHHMLSVKSARSLYIELPVVGDRGCRESSTWGAAVGERGWFRL
jgi:hypothetical protein